MGEKPTKTTRLLGMSIRVAYDVNLIKKIADIETNIL